MLQKNYLASERFYECLNCNEAIFNPLCPACLATHVEAWLSLYPDLSEKTLPIIKTYLEKTKTLVEKSTKCIACGKKQAYLCPYCFTEFVLGVLKKLEVNKQIFAEFFQFFNFDFEHTGYSKEAERLGVI